MPLDCSAMGEHSCDCTASPAGQAPTTNETATDETPTDARLLGDGDELDTRLPEDLQAALGAFLDDPPIETLGEWVTAVRRETGGGAIAVDDLCHAETVTDHWGETAEERYHFECFYDAVVLATLTETAVDIRTASPDGDSVEARADGDGGLSVTPSDAVFSFGIDTAAAAESDGDPALADVYQANCPYVKAFPDRDAYVTWAERVPAATVAMPLAGATALAEALANA